MKRFVLTISLLSILTAAFPAAAGKVYDFSGFESQLEAYLCRFHDPGAPCDPYNLRGDFSYQPGGRADLYGSIDMAYVLWTIDELDKRASPEGRAAWAAFIQQGQDPRTGWFNRGNETAHFREHATAYATGGLALLDARPLHPFAWSKRMTRSRAAHDLWLSTTWWDVVWVGSHQGGGGAASLEMTGSAPPEWWGWYFGWLDREVNPETGLWQRASYNVVYQKPTVNDLGGAAHFWWMYERKGRPMPYPRQAIDSILSLQLPSGHWDDKRLDFPYCIDLDAIQGLNLAHAQLAAAGDDYRAADIVAALDRFLAYAAATLNPPGALEHLYRNSHDLPGALVAIAEADRCLQRITGSTRLQTKKPWRSVLTKICWL